MNGDVIPDQHNIARYCGPQHVDNGQILGTAFWLKETEDDLSVNWLESLHCDSRDREVLELRNIYNEKKLGVSQKARRDAIIAVLNVGETRHKVFASEISRNLTVLHHPIPDDPSHSGIHNLKPNNEMIAEIILLTIQNVYPRK